jgi:outer membrane immunogenic protein
MGLNAGQSSRDFPQNPARNTGDFDANGVIGGATAGYNLMWQSVLLGVEGDFSGSSASGSRNCSPAQTTNCQTTNPWLATVRLRLGYPIGSVLPYATGGLAVGQIGVRSTVSTGGTGVDLSTNETGWAAGAGIEWAFDSAWSVKAEYLRVQLDDAHTVGASGLPNATSFNANIVRVGVNYRFRL